MYANRILLVDDDDVIRSGLSTILKSKGFDVTTAASALEALELIDAKSYDVLLTDLYMSGTGDGQAVVSAMRRKNPDNVTMLLSAFPEMDTAALAVLSQTEVLLKPVELSSLVDDIVKKLARKRLSFVGHGVPASLHMESVASILERSANECIDEWSDRVQRDSKLNPVSLTREERCNHLPRVFRDLVKRLHANLPPGAEAPLSAAAAAHGLSRRKEGYTASMLVEESRMLELSIFHTLQKNLANLNSSTLLYAVMTIADEVDAQLRQAMDCFVDEAHP